MNAIASIASAAGGLAVQRVSPVLFLARSGKPGISFAGQLRRPPVVLYSSEFLYYTKAIPTARNP